MKEKTKTDQEKVENEKEMEEVKRGEKNNEKMEKLKNAKSRGNILNKIIKKYIK